MSPGRSGISAFNWRVAHQNADLVLVLRPKYWRRGRQLREIIGLRAGYRQTGRARVSVQRMSISKGVAAALIADGQLPDFAFGFLLANYISQWAFDDRLSRTSRTPGRPLRGLLRAGRADLDDVAQRETRLRGPVRAADGPYDQPHSRLGQPLLWSRGFTLDDIPRMGAVWSSGATQAQPAVRK